ncbi:hypothetical protein BHF71_07820 [Vulcanibacillus modesticaldus]|uniref:Regulatory protein YycH domain-containing protein n=1 Tax=Vulcanibacillus modesticaldus TaxID=337097 RepID=A0A1D2YVB1_9BACI|nr:two-component system activity regulator YycH [Vulcanibacillus modesticaldus]OEF99660.1 hypothetical protein BHF71_07820 [Vulcanibacillus modesticaldus]
MKEKVKSIILFLLVINSIVLTLFLSFYNFNSSSVSISEYLPQPKFGQDIDLVQLLSPEKIIYHFGKNAHSVIRPNVILFYQMEKEMKGWTFYNFTKAENKIDWKDIVENREGIEIYFPIPLTNSLISSIINIPATKINIEEVNRLWIFLNQKNKVEAYFISDNKDQVFTAEVTISDQQLTEYISKAVYQTKYSYHFVGSINKDKSIKRMYYLPVEGTNMKVISRSYTTLTVDDFKQLLFIDSSMVRKVYEMNDKKSILYTDGTYSMQYDSMAKKISFYQPVFGQKKDLNLDRGLYVAIRYVNQHGGWDGIYRLAKNQRIRGNQTNFGFRKYIEGYPILAGDYGIIQMQVTDGIVNLFQRSAVLLDKYTDIKIIKTLNGLELITYLEKIGVNESDIKTIKLGYKVKGIGNSYIFEPYWKIYLLGQKPIEIPAYEGGV